MRVLRRTTVISAALFLAVLPLASQDHTTAAGYGLGLINPGRLNPGVGQLPLKMDEGWALTAFGETWHAAEGRMGLRLAAAFTQRPLSIGGELRDVNTWFADASVILRLLPPTAGRAVAPFVSVGGGLAQYGLGTGPPLIYQEEGVVYPGEQRLQGTAVVGAGLDIVPGGFRIAGAPLGLRLDVADHVLLRSPFRGLEGDAGLGPIHNLRFGVSLIGLGWF
jgi:hypothetical protein